MFSMPEKSTRPDRCELCRHSICMSVGNPHQPGAYDTQWSSTVERRVCKRFPPTAAADGGFGVSPYVGDGNWCGEFAPRGSQES